MASLVHDAPLRSSRNGRTRRVSRAERMASIFRCIHPCALRQFLHDSRHIQTGQPTRLNVPVPVNRPEQRARRDGRQFQPALESPDWARLGIRPVGNTHPPADALPIRLGPPQRHIKTILAECAILNVQPY